MQEAPKPERDPRPWWVSVPGGGFGGRGACRGEDASELVWSGGRPSVKARTPASPTLALQQEQRGTATPALSEGAGCPGGLPVRIAPCV